MAVQVYGCNHVAIEVDNAEKAVAFYADVFDLEMLRGGEGAAWCKLGLKLEPHFRCDFRDPWGNRIQVGDLQDESLVWLLPYREVQTTGIKFTE